QRQRHRQHRVHYVAYFGASGLTGRLWTYYELRRQQRRKLGHGDKPFGNGGDLVARDDLPFSASVPRFWGGGGDWP
ncbi:MAG: hypothetical protein ACRDQZ_23005, partial [Mycobacteriales bacterium]